MLLACGCARLHRPRPEAGAPVALYRGRILEADGRTRTFRLLLYAALPDRIHAEVLSPMGTSHLILDAGAGRVALTFPQEKVAYVGTAGPDVLERVVGLRGLSLEPFARFVLTGEADPPPGISVRRAPPRGEGLPRRLEIATADRRLVFERRERPASGPLGAELGTGSPPPGVEVRPIEELPPLNDPTR